MLGNEILNEARVHGALSSNELFVGISDNGSDVLVLPKEIVNRDNGRMKFELSDAGQALVAKIIAANPNSKAWGGRIDEIGAKRDLQANIDQLAAEFVPKFDTSGMDPSLVKFYHDSFQQQMSRDFEQLWSNFKSSMGFGKDYQLTVYVGFYALEFLHLNLQTQTVDVIHRDKEHNTRMGTYKGGQTTYMLIDADFSVNDKVKLVKALKSLVGKFPALADFNFVDGRSGQTTSTPLSQVIAGKDTSVQKLVTATTASVTAYHGTSKAILKQIITDGFMSPGKGPEYHDKILGHSERLVYFTMDIEEARKYAVRAAGGRESVIIKAEINDMTRLKFDEDGLYMAIRKIPERVYTQFENLFYKVFNIEVEEKFKSRGNLESHLRGNLILKYSEFTEPQRKLMGYLNGIVLKSRNMTSGYSFGYEGRLPLSKLTLVEQFKSEKYIDGHKDHDYSAQYDKVKSTQEFPNIPLTSFKKKPKK